MMLLCPYPEGADDPPATALPAICSRLGCLASRTPRSRRAAVAGSAVVAAAESAAHAIAEAEAAEAEARHDHAGRRTGAVGVGRRSVGALSRRRRVPGVGRVE